eukprot:5028122-Ditylum_brightwellii.AAC.1
MHRTEKIIFYSRRILMGQSLSSLTIIRMAVVGRYLLHLRRAIDECSPWQKAVAEPGGGT